MAVLVAGVGYIGAKLVEDLLARGEEVMAIDNFFSTSRRAIERFCQHERFTFIKGNITDSRALSSAFSVAPISTVYALAAQASAHPAAATPRYTENTNLIGHRLLLDASKAAGAKTIAFASSFKVYGANLPPVVDESLPYGQFADLSHLSKCYAEKLLELYATTHGMRCLALRLGIVYGMGPVMKRDYRFITAPNKFCLQAVRGEQIELNPGANAPTGFIHVSDASRAMIDAVDEPLFAGYTPINAVTEVASVREVATMVATEAKKKGLPDVIIKLYGIAEPSSSGQGEQTKSVAPRPRVISSLGAPGERPRRTLWESLAEVLDYFKEAGGKD